MTASRMPLGVRMLVAFVSVAVVSVALLTAAALIGTQRGVGAAQAADRRQSAARAAGDVADAYQRAGGWAGADLAAADAVADAAGAKLVVRDSGMAMMWPGHAPANGRPGTGRQSTGDTVSAPVVVDGRQIGTAILVFERTSRATTVAWQWVLSAAATALIIAVGVSVLVSRRLSRPVLAVTAAAQAFASGDRVARSPTTGPGELGRLARAVNTMADAVVHAEQTRRRIAADVAHELRTPLASLQAGLEELRDGLDDPSPARLAALHDQSLRLGRVVDDLAHLSAAEAAAVSLRLADADLAGLAASAIAAQEPALRAAGLTLRTELDQPVPVRADVDRMHQAVGNLLANAARYCRSGDTVRVRAYAVGDAAVLQVADTGPGIPPADLPHVFDRLWRRPSSTGVAGSRIGLAVVRELVTAHGGTVHAESLPSHGSTFTIRLSMAATVDRRPPPADS